MTNRDKGKRGERWAAIELRPYFPNIRRNAGTQSQSGGVDLENTPGFSFEIKFGKSYKSKMLRDVISQVKAEGSTDTCRVAIIKPDREEPYVAMPFNDFKILIDKYLTNNR